MNRLNTIFIAVGTAAAAALFAPSVQAQSGHALAVAEQACLGKHIKPNTTAFNHCVNDTRAPTTRQLCRPATPASPTASIRRPRTTASASRTNRPATARSRISSDQVPKVT